MVEIGYIECNCFFLDEPYGDLYPVTNSIGGHLQKVIRYFYEEEASDFLVQYVDDYGIYPDYLFYGEYVEIYYEDKGHDYGLCALALLLNYIARRQLVALYPVW